MRACSRHNSCHHAGRQLAFAILSSAVAASGAACAGGNYRPAGLSLGAGAASISCRCPEGQGTLQLPVSAAVELSGGRAGRPGVYGLKLAYDLVPVVGVGATEWALRHGGHVELKLGIATGMGRHGLPAGAEAGVWTIGALAAYWPTIDGEAPMRFLGLTVGWQFPL